MSDTKQGQAQDRGPGAKKVELERRLDANAEVESTANARPTPDPIDNGGTEDLMVDGSGGALPLKGTEPPHYYADAKKAEKKPKA